MNFNFFFVLFDKIATHGKNVLQSFWDCFCPRHHVELGVLCR